MVKNMKKIYIIGVGMGNPETLTLQGDKIIRQADVLIGASRLTREFCKRYGKSGVAYIGADEIMDFIEEFDGENFAVLMSGDTGFYSGSKRLCKLIDEKNNHDNYECHVIAGISTLQYFAGKLKTNWDNIKCVSLHGRSGNPVGEVLENERTFFLLGSNMAAAEICKNLTENNLGNLKVYIGQRLSYDDERIEIGAAEDFIDAEFDKLSVILVENPKVVNNKGFYVGIDDKKFVRGKVPMTKSEVRAVTMSKIDPIAEDVIWDIGAGTGSITVELALAAKRGRVLAVESNEDGSELIRENVKNFGLQNVKVLHGMAPEILGEENNCIWAKPDKVFVGGSKGNLAAIFETVFHANPEAKIVINAITMETLTEAVNLVKQYNLNDLDICQVSVNKTHQVGKYNMFEGANPVFIISGRGSVDE